MVFSLVDLHRPVMEEEVIHYLFPRSSGVYVDATLGDGGHAEAILNKLDNKGHLIGIDWDDEALKRAEERLFRFRTKVTLIHADYSNLEEVLIKTGIPAVDGILIDLGASTLQLMDAKRGFSLHQEGELDMRMDRRRSLTAKEVVNSYTAAELADIFFNYGEERWSKRIAAAIISEREKSGPITDSKKLAEVVKEAIPARFRRRGGHPSRRVFQALRLEVNSELENISTVLPQAVRCLAARGRICVIAYHSLEDRLVKKYFREQARSCTCPPQRPCICSGQAELRVITRKAIKPERHEVEVNPRARSARLRAAEKIKKTEQKEGE